MTKQELSKKEISIIVNKWNSRYGFKNAFSSMEKAFPAKTFNCIYIDTVTGHIGFGVDKNKLTEYSIYILILAWIERSQTIDAIDNDGYYIADWENSDKYAYDFSNAVDAHYNR